MPTTTRQQVRCEAVLAEQIKVVKECFKQRLLEFLPYVYEFLDHVADVIEKFEVSDKSVKFFASLPELKDFTHLKDFMTDFVPENCDPKTNEMLNTFLHIYSEKAPEVCKHEVFAFFADLQKRLKQVEQ